MTGRENKKQEHFVRSAVIQLTNTYFQVKSKNFQENHLQNKFSFSLLKI